MKIEIVQTAPHLSRKNLEEAVEIIRESEADLILFPELALNGYNLKDALLEYAFEIEELEVFKNLDKNICIGVALKEGHKIFNASIYFDKSGDYYIYKKRHLPNYGLFEEARFFFAGDKSFSFDTEFGKVAMFICEDMFAGDTLNFIAEEKPDIVLVLANSPAREFKEDRLLIQENWYSILKTASLLSGGYTLFANRVGFEDGLGFWGGSAIVTPKGEIEKSAKLFEVDTIFTTLNRKLSVTQKYYLRKN
jgi:predicted amidohydrolase